MIAPLLDRLDPWLAVNRPDYHALLLPSIAAAGHGNGERRLRSGIGLQGGDPHGT